MPKELRDFDDGPLIPDENRKVRRILEADNSFRWFASFLKNFALWLTAVAAGIVAWFQIFPGGDN